VKLVARIIIGKAAIESGVRVGERSCANGNLYAIFYALARVLPLGHPPRLMHIRSPHDISSLLPIDLLFLRHCTVIAPSMQQLH
jgi:hypothetical protein